MKTFATALAAAGALLSLAPLAKADELRPRAENVSAVVVIGPTHHRHPDDRYSYRHERPSYHGHYWYHGRPAHPDRWHRDHGDSRD